MLASSLKPLQVLYLCFSFLASSFVFASSFSEEESDSDQSRPLKRRKVTFQEKPPLSPNPIFQSQLHFSRALKDFDIESKDRFSEKQIEIRGAGDNQIQSFQKILGTHPNDPNNIDSLVAYIRESLLEEKSLKDFLTQSVFEIRHNQEQVFLRDTFNYTEEDQCIKEDKKRLYRMWRFIFYENDKIGIENIVQKSFLGVDQKGQLIFISKNQKVTENIYWKLIPATEQRERERQFFVLQNLKTQKFLSVRDNKKSFHLSLNQEIENELSFLWKFRRVYSSFSDEVISDWGQMVALHHNVSLLKLQTDQIIDHLASQEEEKDAENYYRSEQEHYTLLPNSTIWNLNDRAIAITTNDLEESQTSNEYKRGDELGQVKKKNHSLTKSLNANQALDFTQDDGSTLIKSRNKRVSDNATKEKSQMSTRRRDDTQEHSSGMIHSYEDNQGANRQFSKGTDERFSEGTSEEKGKTTSKGTSSTSGSSNQSTTTHEHGDEERTTTENSDTTYSDKGSHQETTVGGGVEISAKYKAEAGIPGLGSTGVSVGGRVHFSASHSWGSRENSGKSNTKSSATSNSKFNKTTNSNTSSNYSEQTSTHHEENSQKNTKSVSNERGYHSSSIQSLDVHRKDANTKNAEKRTSHNVAQGSENISKEMIIHNKEKEKGHSDSYNSRFQKHQSDTLTEDLQVQAGQNLDEEEKFHNSHASGASGRSHRIHDSSTQISPYSILREHKLTNSLSEYGIIDLKIHILTGKYLFEFSKPLDLKKIKSLQDERNTQNSWYITPKTILNLLPVPHSRIEQIKGKEHLFYGSRMENHHHIQGEGKYLEGINLRQ